MNEKIKVEKIEHVGIAVKSVGEVLEFYRDVLGLKIREIKGGLPFKIAIAEVGESEIEFLEDPNAEGVISRHIQKRGEGIQHLGLTVDDLKSTLRKLKKKGVTPIGGDPAPGTQPLTAWLHPKITHGVLIELCDKRHKCGAGVTNMEA